MWPKLEKDQKGYEKARYVAMRAFNNLEDSAKRLNRPLEKIDRNEVSEKFF